MLPAVQSSWKPRKGYFGMSYFLLLRPFHILSGMAVFDGEGSPHFHEPEGAKMPQAKTKDGLRNMGSKNSWFWWTDV